MMGWRRRRRMTDRMSSRELESHLSRRGGEGLGSRAWKHVRPLGAPPPGDGSDHFSSLVPRTPA